MKKSSITLLLTVLIIILSSCTKNEQSWELSSPNEEIRLSLSLDNSELFYTVSTKNNGKWQQIIDPSPLGIKRTDSDFTNYLSFESSTDIIPVEESYEMLIGNSPEYYESANSQSYIFKNKDNKTLRVDCKAYDEGVAFRYVFPEQNDSLFEVTGEITGFNLPDSGKAWIQPYDTIVWWAPAYEQFFMNGIEIGSTAPENRNGWCFPMLFEARNQWIYVSEAGLEPSYAGSHLEAEAPGGLYTVRLPEPDEAYNYFPRNPKSSLPWKMPWRYILVTQDLEKIFNSSHVYHLSKPARIENTEWIHPGISSWSWWSNGKSPGEYEILKKFVDFSAKMGWRYTLVDAGWHEMNGGNIQMLTDYAKTKGVGVLLWYDSGGRVGYVKGAQSKLMFVDSTREVELKRIADMGVKGIKVDFFQSDKQGMIQLYYDILEDAAKNELVVNFHGCTMPRGWSRTFPNLLTMEAIRGGEAYRFDRTYTTYGPLHNTIIPFTRNVAGPVDYTPVTLTDNRFPHNTTYAHELALAVIFESGIQHFADYYKKYESLPASALDYLSKVSPTWDVSLLIDGYPGKDAIIARKKDDTWFIAGINGENSKKPVEFSTEFLDEGDYTLTLITDGKSRDDLIIEIKELSANDPVKIEMNGDGGFAGYIEKKGN